VALTRAGSPETAPRRSEGSPRASVGEASTPNGPAFRCGAHQGIAAVLFGPRGAPEPVEVLVRERLDQGVYLEGRHDARPICRRTPMGGVAWASLGERTASRRPGRRDAISSWSSCAW